MRFTGPDRPKFEEANFELRKRPEPALWTHPVRCLMKSCVMNHIGQPAEPNRELVEWAIVEVLEIAQREGITAADFLQMLDSGMRVSDFLTAMGIPADADAEDSFDCDS
jgi:hypothetical protein